LPDIALLKNIKVKKKLNKVTFWFS
jgi:hypothetical protein